MREEELATEEEEDEKVKKTTLQRPVTIVDQHMRGTMGASRSNRFFSRISV